MQFPVESRRLQSQAYRQSEKVLLRVVSAGPSMQMGSTALARLEALMDPHKLLVQG